MVNMFSYEYAKDLVKMKEEKLLYEFIYKYDENNNLGFDSINYRKGASNTGHFCLEEGFKVIEINGKKTLEWGWVRIHSGVDRGRGKTHEGVENVIMAPFDFESSRFEDYDGKVYGTLVVLISEKFGFEFRIAHMFPNKILIMNDLVNKKPIKRDTIIGPTGSYGVGSGVHTHTEVKSIEENSPVLEDLLEKKFGIEIYEEYKANEVIEFYKKMNKFEGASFDTVFNDYEEQKEKRRCFFANKYLYRYVDFDGTKKTRYSSELLWNGV
jgi:murein DD-endopeptidase MepM/ murein hydrolase activator NlpD